MNFRTIFGSIGLIHLAIQASASVLYVNVSNSVPATPFVTWNTAATNIQDAVDVATGGDLILVSNGVYRAGGRVIVHLGSLVHLTNRVVIDKAITVQSVNGPLRTVIMGNSPVGNQAVRCVSLGENASLIGFTLTNGATLFDDTGSITAEFDGGGAWCQSGSVISNCIITACAAGNLGGGIRCEGNFPRILDSVITGCMSTAGGGVMGGSLNNCLLTRNSANSGGGAMFSILNHCTLVGNEATNGGGGASSCFLKNCISFFNHALFGANYSDYSLDHCCTTPLPDGIGNLTNEPAFVNAALGDCHLQANSPCINAGNNADVSATADLDGNPRIVGGTVDMGAYEFQLPSSILSYAWAQHYNLAIDGSADNADADVDGMSNWEEWIAGTNPTNALSALQLASPVLTKSPVGVAVTWQSVSGIIYYLQRSSDLTGEFSSIQSNLVGQAGTTSFTDSTATNGDSFFYRVGVQ